MTKEEKEFLTNVIRVGVNLGVLLDIGAFPGKHAVGLSECQAFVKQLVEDNQAKLTALTPPPPPADLPKPDAPAPVTA